MCLQFLLGVKMAPRETENNAYAKFWVTNKSIMVCYGIFWSGQYDFCNSWSRDQLSVNTKTGRFWQKQNFT